MGTRPVTRAKRLGRARRSRAPAPNVSAALADLALAAESIAEGERLLAPATSPAQEAALAHVRFTLRRIEAARVLLGEQVGS